VGLERVLRAPVAALEREETVKCKMAQLGPPLIPLTDRWLEEAKMLCATENAAAPLTPHSQLCHNRNEEYTPHRIVQGVEFVHSAWRGSLDNWDAWKLVDVEHYLPEQLEVLQPKEPMPNAQSGQNVSFNSVSPSTVKKRKSTHKNKHHGGGKKRKCSFEQV
jgi:hypothetical protein